MTDEPVQEYVTERPTIDVDELRKDGYIVEINRLILHPLGLALGTEEDDGPLVVFDGRDDPGGVTYDLEDPEYRDILTGKAQRFKEIQAERRQGRIADVGFFTQTLTPAAAAEPPAVATRWEYVEPVITAAQVTPEVEYTPAIAAMLGEPWVDTAD